MAITKKLSNAWKFTIAMLISEGVGITSGLLANGLIT